MGDTQVDLFLENLHNLQTYRSNLISNIKNQLQKMEKDLRLFKAFLKDSDKKRRKDESLQKLAREIHDVVIEADDTTDAFVTQTLYSDSRSYFRRAFGMETEEKLRRVVKDMETIAAKVREVYRHNNPNTEDGRALQESELGRDSDSDMRSYLRRAFGMEEPEEKLRRVVKDMETLAAKLREVYPHNNPNTGDGSWPPQESEVEGSGQVRSSGRTRRRTK